jgi:hypothetical protein
MSLFDFESYCNEQIASQDSQPKVSVAIPVLSVEDALLAALPPEISAGNSNVRATMDSLEQLAMGIITNMGSQDTAALLLRFRLSDVDDVLVKRFRRFGESRQTRLLERLQSSKRRAAVRAREHWLSTIESIRIATSDPK